MIEGEGRGNDELSALSYQQSAIRQIYRQFLFLILLKAES